MREGKRFECPQCGEVSPIGVSCARCDTTMIDENGNPPLKPKLPRPSFVTSGWTIAGGAFTFGGWMVFRQAGQQGAIHPTAGLVGFALIAAGLASFGLNFSFPRWVARRDADARRIRALSTLGRAGDVVPIGAAAREIVRIRGRVHVIRASSTVAEAGADFPSPAELDCGRFAIVDPTGVAVVDDDCFEIWSRTDGRPDHLGGRVLHGMMVEVVGKARVEDAPDTGSIGESGYRESPKALVFDGRPDAPVVVLV